MDSLSPPDDSRTTKGITHEQRYYLCLKKQECPYMKQSELATWFKEKYCFPISQPTISHSLKRSAEILSEGLSTPGIETTRVRKRPVRHPELELAIYEWVKSQQQQQQQQQENDPLRHAVSDDSVDGFDDCNKSIEVVEPITGPILLREAKRIALEMDIKDTVFCPGWLSRFKARYGLKSSSRINSANSQLTGSASTFDNANVSLPSSPLSDHSLSTLSSNSGIGGIQDHGVMSSIEVRPSIAVPSSINTAHSTLHRISHQDTHDTLATSAHTTPPGLSNYTTDNPSQKSLSTVDSHVDQFSSQQQQHTQQKMFNQHHQRDLQFLQPYRRQYYPGSSTPSGPHSFQQQRPSHTPHPSVATQSTSSAIHLDFLQSVPIAAPSDSNNFKHSSTSPSLPPSIQTVPIVGPVEPSFLSPSSSVVSSGNNNNIDQAHNTPSTRSNILVATSAFAPLSLQDVQQLLDQLKYYVGLHLQDPTTALQSLETLGRELDITRTRGSITISENNVHS